MYQQGSGDYDYQDAHYGHPSRAGMKDVDHAWHAENWSQHRWDLISRTSCRVRYEQVVVSLTLEPGEDVRLNGTLQPL